VLQRAAILDDAAALVWAAGRRDEAAGCLVAALDLALRAGAARDAARIRQRFADLGLRRPRRPRSDRAPHELTRGEAAVADLVALGRTNNEVAEHLGISPRTVETHLTRIYAKLGVRSRTELAAARPP
jgi:DNA-binding NarL/FixJ family response regulator